MYILLKNGFLIILICLWNITLYHSAAYAELQLGDLVMVVSSQPTKYHTERARLAQEDLFQQTSSSSGLDVVLMHLKWPTPKAWTILPLMPDISKEYGSKKAVIFCEEETRVDLMKLLEKLRDFADLSQPLFMGRALRDKDATIIHHFAFYEDPSSFAYPDFAACVIFSLAMVNHLANELSTRLPKNADFNIDAKHELSLYVWNDGNGYALTDVDFLCAGNEHEGCATSYPIKFPDCGEPVHEDTVYIGVKTCANFHKDRVPIVQKTWGKDAKHMEFYSEIADPQIPTLSTGIPNTEKGHCGKLQAIINRMHTDPSITDKTWLVIVDDDTILGVSRLHRLLACYDPSEPLAIGERYGFGLFAHHAYNYITGGGGIVLSRQAVSGIMDATEGVFCSSNSSPDDMTLGALLQRLDIPVIHSPLFHQARPNDYSDGYLSHQEPISFHKHWMIDPYVVYQQWFEHASKVQPQQWTNQHEDL